MPECVNDATALNSTSKHIKICVCVAGVCYMLPGKNNDTRCIREGAEVDCDTPMLSGSKMEVYQGDQFYMNVYCSDNAWKESRVQHKYKRDRMNH